MLIMSGGPSCSSVCPLLGSDFIPRIEDSPHLQVNKLHRNLLNGSVEWDLMAVQI